MFKAISILGLNCLCVLNESEPWNRFSPLKTKLRLLYLKTQFVPYRAVNTFNFGYKNQAVCVVWVRIRCLFWYKYKTHKVWAECKNLLVHHVTTRLFKVSLVKIIGNNFYLMLKCSFWISSVSPKITEDLSSEYYWTAFSCWCANIIPFNRCKKWKQLCLLAVESDHSPYFRDSEVSFSKKFDVSTQHGLMPSVCQISVRNFCNLQFDFEASCRLLLKEQQRFEFPNFQIYPPYSFFTSSLLAILGCDFSFYKFWPSPKHSDIEKEAERLFVPTDFTGQCDRNSLAFEVLAVLNKVPV